MGLKKCFSFPRISSYNSFIDPMKLVRLFVCFFAHLFLTSLSEIRKERQVSTLPGAHS